MPFQSDTHAKETYMHEQTHFQQLGVHPQSLLTDHGVLVAIICISILLLVGQAHEALLDASKCANQFKVNRACVQVWRIATFNQESGSPRIGKWCFQHSTSSGTGKLFAIRKDRLHRMQLLPQVFDFCVCLLLLSYRKRLVQEA